MLDKIRMYLDLIGLVLGMIRGELSRTLRFRRVRKQAARLGTTPTASRTHNIVVVGASFAGQQAARVLARSLPPDSTRRVVVVEPNSHFQFTWVLPRFCVLPGGHEHKAFIPYGKFTEAPDGALTWIKDRVVEVRDGEVVLGGSGETLPYEFLVLATGAAVKSGLPSRVNATEKEEGVKLLQGVQQKIADAQTVVVVGGGAAGVEVATDAKSLYPNKNIILVHSRSAVMHRFGKELQKAALEGLQGLGVEVILEDRVVEETEASVTLKSGRKLNCNYFINCTGQKPNSSLLETLSPSSVSADGYIKVKPTLQLVDDRFPNIYSCGDVTDTDVATPNARSAMQEANVASENILLALEGKAPTHEYKHKWLESVIKLTLGLDRSVTNLGNGRSEIMFRGKEKKKDLMSADVWRHMGQKPYEDDSYHGEKAA